MQSEVSQSQSVATSVVEQQESVKKAAVVEQGPETDELENRPDITGNLQRPGPLELVKQPSLESDARQGLGGKDGTVVPTEVADAIASAGQSF